MNNTANTKDRGTQREILRKRPKTNNNMNKASEDILSIFGDCWEKCYPFLTPSKADRRVPRQQGTTYIMFKHYWPVWVWPKRGGRFLTHNT